MPGSVAELGGSAFEGCTSLASVELPSTLTSIGSSAFSDCSLLSSVILPTSLTSVGASAFGGCSSLAEVELPASLTSLGRDAFGNCIELCPVTVPLEIDANQAFYYYSPFSNNPKLKIRCLSYSSAYAWAREHSIRVDLIDKVTTTSVLIDSGTSGGIAWKVYKDTTVTSSIPSLHNEGIDLAYDWRLVVSSAGTGIMPDYQDGEQPWASYLADLDSLVIEDGVVTIGNYAFAGMVNENPGYSGLCKSGALEDVDIPASCTRIGDHAFDGSCALARVYVGKSLRFLSKAGGAFNNTNATLRCYLDSLAYEYAIHNNVPYSLVSDSMAIRSTPITLFSGLADEGNKDVAMSFDWGWGLFNKDSSTYDNRLAMVSLALSSAIEETSGLRGDLAGYDRVADILHEMGFEYHDIQDVNFNTGGEVARPAAVFGFKQLVMKGEIVNLFVIDVRGTTDWGDIHTDLASVLDDFSTAEQDVLSQFRAFRNTGDRANVTKRASRDIYLLTGHSLGGAVANRLAASLMTSGNVFCYSFAPPRCTNDRQPYAGIFNIINTEDVVPTLLPSSSSWNGYNILWSRGGYSSDLYACFSRLTGGKNLKATMESLWLLDEMTKIQYAHSPSAYMAYLPSKYDGNSTDLFNTCSVKRVSVHCPVDVEVVSKDGTVLAKVENDVPTVQNGALVYVNGSQKDIYLLDGMDFDVRIVGTGVGTMRYALGTASAASTQAVEHKVFEGVDIQEGKCFLSSVADGNDVATELYVVDDKNDELAEVGANGSEVVTDEAILAVVAAIDALPSVDELRYADASSVREAREAFDALNDARKALVGNVGKLVALEERLVVLAPKSIATARVSLSKTSYVYNGAACLPAVTVSLDGASLVPGTDYAVSYRSNVDVGTATAVVTGTGAPQLSMTSKAPASTPAVLLCFVPGLSFPVRS